MSTLAEYGYGHQAHESILISFLGLLEYQTRAKELCEAQSSIYLRVSKPIVEHDTPDEPDTSKDAADGSNVGKEKVIMDIHASKHFVGANECESIEE